MNESQHIPGPQPDGIVKRLLEINACDPGCDGRCIECPDDLAGEAAAEITRLRAIVAGQPTQPDEFEGHTPGPWQWERLIETDNRPRVAEFTLKGPDVLCRYWYDNPPSIDARLIAAAPDLFEAIINSDDAHWTVAMRAALAKATGAAS